MLTITIPFKPKPNLNLSLHSGAANGNLGLVKFALDNGQPIDSLVCGMLAIHLASGNGHIQVVQYLLERGCSVDARKVVRRISDTLLVRESGKGATPLHYAAANGHFDLVKFLLDNGANPNLTDKYGTTAFEVAVAKKHYDSASLILKVTYQYEVNKLQSKRSSINWKQQQQQQQDNELEGGGDKDKDKDKYIIEDDSFSFKIKGKPTLNFKKLFRKNDRDTNLNLSVNLNYPNLVLPTPPSPALC